LVKFFDLFFLLLFNTVVFDKTNFFSNFLFMLFASRAKLPVDGLTGKSQPYFQRLPLLLLLQASLPSYF